MPDHIICMRNLDAGGAFGSEPNETRYLRVPSNQNPRPDHQIDVQSWLNHVCEEGKTGTDPMTKRPLGDILVFVHGYNNSPRDVIQRHRQLKANLAQAGWQGAVISFDWPSAESALNYLEDREDAKFTALALVRDGIVHLAQAQTTGCQLNVHLLGHSMGAYVIREAFDDADDRPAIAAMNWTVSQVCMIGADISSESMGVGNARSASLYRHAVRITNYFTPYDGILKLSNTKRAGTAPRLGRVGLPTAIPTKAADIDCGPYFSVTYGARADASMYAHGWYIDDMVFINDLALTLQGDIDRNRLPTRKVHAPNRLELQKLPA